MTVIVRKALDLIILHVFISCIYNDNKDKDRMDGAECDVSSLTAGAVSAVPAADVISL